MDIIAKNYKEVLDKISKAAIMSGRNFKDITLVAVTKTVDINRMQSAHNIGARIFGENRPQELKRKFPDFPDCKWHMIGQLQTNKVKYIVGKAAMVQSLDRDSLIAELQKRYHNAGLSLDVTLQINIGNEPQKSGIEPCDMIEFAKKVSDAGSLNLRGLMCIPPVCENAEDSRIYFKRMQRLFLELGEKFQGIDTLSMGMSADYFQAILEGATMVRVGSSIFGHR